MVDAPETLEADRAALSWAPMQREAALCQEEAEGRLRFELVQTEALGGCRSAPTLAQMLLADLIEEQLPAMGRDHIASVLFNPLQARAV